MSNIARQFVIITMEHRKEDGWGWGLDVVVNYCTIDECILLVQIQNTVSHWKYRPKQDRISPTFTLVEVKKNMYI